MAWTTYHLFLTVLMVITGSINTLAIKWSDEIKSRGADNFVKPFHHPFFQAMCMFIGEFLCLVVFKILCLVYNRKEEGTIDKKGLTKGNRDFNPSVLFFPAMCDMIGTSMMYIGLNLTYASSYQMFRGAVIVFIAILSMSVLKKFLGIRQWLGIALVLFGLMLVGLADYFSEKTGVREHTELDIIMGDIIIVIAQIMVATQMVLEEKYVTKLDIPPLQAAGWEGIFGFVVLVFLQIAFYFIRSDPPVTQHKDDRLEDAVDAIVQMRNSWHLCVAIIGTIISIAFYNFAGISVTKELSATTRKVLDSLRTIIIWMFSMMLFGQKFHWLQLIGFIILIAGMSLYNHITLESFVRMFGRKPPESEEVPQ